MAKKADTTQSGTKRKQAKVKRITLLDLEDPQGGKKVKGGRFSPDPNFPQFKIN